MAYRPTDRELEALAQLKHNQDVIGLLKLRLDAYQQVLIEHPDETQMRMFQGRAQEVRDILKLIDTASDALQRKA